MENILKEILDEIKTMKSQVNKLEADVKEINEKHGQQLKTLEIGVTGIKEEHGKN